MLDYKPNQRKPNYNQYRRHTFFKKTQKGPKLNNIEIHYNTSQKESCINIKVDLKLKALLEIKTLLNEKGIILPVKYHDFTCECRVCVFPTT